MALFNKKNIEEVKQVVWYEEILEAYKDNTKRAFTFGCSGEKGILFILTNDNKIVCNSKKFQEESITDVIDIKDILKADLNIITTDKMVAPFFAVLGTYNFKSTIDYIELKIVTFDKIYRYKYKEVLPKAQNQTNIDNLEIIITYLQKIIN